MTPIMRLAIHVLAVFSGWLFAFFFRIVSLASGDAPLVWGPVEREEAEPPDQAAEEGSAE